MPMAASSMAEEKKRKIFLYRKKKGSWDNCGVIVWGERFGVIKAEKV